MRQDIIDRYMPATIRVRMRGKSGEVREDEYTLEKQHLKCTAQNGPTKFYGFVMYGSDIVVALQETNLYVAMFKPFYRRLVVFIQFQHGTNLESTIEEDGRSIGVITDPAQREEALRNLFASEPTLKKVGKLMLPLKEIWDSNGYGVDFINAFKEFYD